MLSLILGIAAFVCMGVGYGISATVVWGSYLVWGGVALGVAAWIVGAKAVKRNKQDTASKLGKILGIIATIVGILLVVFAIFLTGYLMNMISGM